MNVPNRKALRDVMLPNSMERRQSRSQEINKERVNECNFKGKKHGFMSSAEHEERFLAEPSRGEMLTWSNWMGMRPQPPGDGEVPRHPRAQLRGDRMEGEGERDGEGAGNGKGKENRREEKDMQCLCWFNQSTDLAVPSYGRFTLAKLSNNLPPAQGSQTPSAGARLGPAINLIQPAPRYRVIMKPRSCLYNREPSWGGAVGVSCYCE